MLVISLRAMSALFNFVMYDRKPSRVALNTLKLLKRPCMYNVSFYKLCRVTGDSMETRQGNDVVKKGGII